MFNPKSNNLLDEQLAFSGLEMSIGPAVVLAGVSAAASIAGGIMGSQQAAANNRRAQRNYEEQQKAAKKQAKNTNKYNKRIYQADLVNYYNNRAYEWETSVKNYIYNQSIQDFQYRRALSEYQASVDNTEKQLIYNSISARNASESEQAALSEILKEDAFQQQSLLVEQLQSEGRSALLQAGRSRAKSIQASAAASGRDRAVMAASLESAKQQAGRNLRDIVLGKFIDDQNVLSSMMIKPERPIDLPLPTLAPERIFIEPMKVDPQYIASPLKQSTFAPIVQGVASAGSAMANPNLYK